ncbi:hypothetical protein M0811_14087 [Anaeramoeba ignava]|uniref:Uncharacterized protein n=1 Tax=Anaeramoeba ignava TaxID=1746090 RepID=A0A9Q0RHD9_ANAIG|nr:hypothetical protein M0811_14087 [Anaeramoeba ignava]
MLDTALEGTNEEKKSRRGLRQVGGDDDIEATEWILNNPITEDVSKTLEESELEKALKMSLQQNAENTRTTKTRSRSR